MEIYKNKNILKNITEALKIDDNIFIFISQVLI